MVQEDARFFAIDKVAAGLGMIATTEKLLSKKIVSFGMPSLPALSLSLARSAYKKRAAISVEDLFDAHDPPQGTWPENHTPLFDYIELVVTEIVFSYMSVEGAINELILPSSTYVRRGKQTETLNGSEIERSISL